MGLTTKHQVLAWDLVEGLGDEKHKGIYFRIAKIYDEFFLREALSIVKDAYNRDKIKAGDRGRYFMGILSAKSESALGGKKESSIYGSHIKNRARRKTGAKKKSRTGKRAKKS